MGWIDATHQTWKLVVFVGWMLVAGIFLTGGNSALAQSTTITQLGFGPGSSTLIAAQGIRQLIHDGSKILRVEIQPGAGGQNRTYWERRKERRGELFVDLNNRDASFPTPVEGLLPVLALFPNAGWGLVTTNPEIRSIRDLRGKVVDVGGIELNSGGFTFLAVLRNGGIDSTKVDLSKQTKNLTDVADQLADGISDVGHSGLINRTQLSPSIVELIRKRRIYLVDQTAEAIAPLAPGTYPYIVCPGAVQREYNLGYDPNRGQKIYGQYSVPATWAGIEVSTDVVYEYVRTVIHGRGRLVNYLPAYGKVLAEQMGHVPMPQAKFHPGARRAFEEAGMTYGLEGIAEWESARKGITCQ